MSCGSSHWWKVNNLQLQNKLLDVPERLTPITLSRRIFAWAMRKVQVLKQLQTSRSVGGFVADAESGQCPNGYI